MAPDPTDVATRPPDIGPAVRCHPIRGTTPREVLLVDRGEHTSGLETTSGPDESLAEAAVRAAGAVGLTVTEPRRVGELRYTVADRMVGSLSVFLATPTGGTVHREDGGVPFWCPTGAIPYDDLWPEDRYWFPVFLDATPFRASFHFAADGRLDGWELDLDVTFDDGAADRHRT